MLVSQIHALPLGHLAQFDSMFGYHSLANSSQLRIFPAHLLFQVHVLNYLSIVAFIKLSYESNRTFFAKLSGFVTPLFALHLLLPIGE